MRYKRLTDTAKIPTYGTAQSAGADLYADSAEPITVAPGETVMVHIGIAVAIPEGHVGLIFGRSGMATKRGLAPANKVGVIDSDYRGELMVSLHNHSGQPQTIAPFERVAQMVIVPCVQEVYEEVDSLDETGRGDGGFGSTGTL